MRQIVRHWPNAFEDGNDVCVRVGKRELDRLRSGWRLTPENRGIQIEQGGNKLSATVQRCTFDHLRLKLLEVLTEQPRFPLQEFNEREQIAVSVWIFQRGLAATPGIDRAL